MITDNDKLSLLCLSAATVAVSISTHKSWNMWLVEALLLLVWVFQWRIRFPNFGRRASQASLVLLSITTIAFAIFTVHDLLH